MLVGHWDRGEGGVSGLRLGRSVALRCPTPPFPKRVTPEGAPDFRSYQRSYREVPEAIRTTGRSSTTMPTPRSTRRWTALKCVRWPQGTARIAAHDELGGLLVRIAGGDGRGGGAAPVNAWCSVLPRSARHVHGGPATVVDAACILAGDGTARQRCGSSRVSSSCSWLSESSKQEI